MNICAYLNNNSSIVPMKDFSKNKLVLIEEPILPINNELKGILENIGCTVDNQIKLEKRTIDYLITRLFIHMLFIKEFYTYSLANKLMEFLIICSNRNYIIKLC